MSFLGKKYYLSLIIHLYKKNNRAKREQNADFTIKSKIQQAIVRGG